MTALAAASALLPPPGPALTLHMAADRLRRAAQAAIARHAEGDLGPGDWYSDMDNALGGPIGEFCGLISPEMAFDLADWFDEIAAAAVRQERAGGSQFAVADGYPTRMAQRILGEAS
jgi:hypothetical protein